MDAQKLAKVLAMAASDNETEALHALRTARRLLDAHGVDFVEVARRVAEGAPGTDPAHAEALEDAVFDLRNEIRHLRAENERLKQGRPGPQPAAEPAGFADAAREAAAAIRLRAELAELRDALEARENDLLHLKAHKASADEELVRTLAEASRAARTAADLDARRMRLEAENRRLATANHALTVELEEIRKERQGLAAQMLAIQTRDMLEGAKAPRVSVRTRAKSSTSQYALF